MNKNKASNKTIFEIDLNNYEDVKHLFNIVKARYFDLKPNRRNKKIKKEKC